MLPLDVRVLTVEEMPEGFHARFDARSKTYEYRIVNAPLVSAFLHRYVWHIPQPLDAEAMRTAAGALIGRHDFAGFQGTGTPVASTERTILALEVEDGGGFDLPLVIRVTGDGFLRHMVRNIVGTLVEVGVGRWDPWRPLAVLDSKDRSQAGRTAPPQGLVSDACGVLTRSTPQVRLPSSEARANSQAPSRFPPAQIDASALILAIWQLGVPRSWELELGS